MNLNMWIFIQVFAVDEYPPHPNDNQIAVESFILAEPGPKADELMTTYPPIVFEGGLIEKGIR